MVALCGMTCPCQRWQTCNWWFGTLQILMRPSETARSQWQRSKGLQSTHSNRSRGRSLGSGAIAAWSQSWYECCSRWDDSFKHGSPTWIFGGGTMLGLKWSWFAPITTHRSSVWKVGSCTLVAWWRSRKGPEASHIGQRHHCFACGSWEWLPGNGSIVGWEWCKHWCRNDRNRNTLAFHATWVSGKWLNSCAFGLLVWPSTHVATDSCWVPDPPKDETIGGSVKLFVAYWEVISLMVSYVYI